MTNPITKYSFCRVLTCDRTRDIGEYCAAHQPTDPTTKAEPIVFERDGVTNTLWAEHKFASVHATPADLAAAGYVSASQLAEANAQLKAAELELAHCREAAELLRRPTVKAEDGETAQALRTWLRRDRDQRQPVASGTEEVEAGSIAQRISPIDGKPIGAKRYGGSTTPVGETWGQQAAEPEATAVVEKPFEPWFDRCLHTSEMTKTQCVKESGHNGEHRMYWPSPQYLSPAVTRAAEAVEAQDPMMRPVTFGELLRLLEWVNVKPGCGAALERIAKGGGK